MQFRINANRFDSISNSLGIECLPVHYQKAGHCNPIINVPGLIATFVIQTEPCVLYNEAQLFVDDVLKQPFAYLSGTVRAPPRTDVFCYIVGFE